MTNLMNDRIVIVKKTREQPLIRLSKYLNYDNTVVHQFCKYKYFNPWYIRWTHSIFRQNDRDKKQNK